MLAFATDVVENIVDRLFRHIFRDRRLGLRSQISLVSPTAKVVAYLGVPQQFSVRHQRLLRSMQIQVERLGHLLERFEAPFSLC